MGGTAFYNCDRIRPRFARRTAEAAIPHEPCCQLNTSCHHLPQLILLHIRPRYSRIVGKDGQPLLWNRLRVVLLLAFDGLQWVEVEGHSPGEVDMRRRGD